MRPGETDRGIVLLTGGAGYIGSHCCVELIQAGYGVLVADNLSNSSAKSLERVKVISGRAPEFRRVDMRDPDQVRSLFTGRTGQGRITSAIHLAGYKAVGESVANPLMYYDNNLRSLLNLCAAMDEHGCRNLVFSSSATVYGDFSEPPFTEEAPLGAVNPYGRTKLIIEDILRDLHQAGLNGAAPAWNISILRYFNPVAAHPSGLIGEDPRGVPSNLMPYICQVAVGRLDKLSIFGGDFDTPDGTGVRDYIHVADLARGHLAALDRLADKPGLMVHNLGTGKGVSVLEMVRAFERVNRVAVPHEVVARRPGDPASVYAAVGKAERELGWTARYGLDEMVRDAWNWQSRNPEGYGE